MTKERLIIKIVTTLPKKTPQKHGVFHENTLRINNPRKTGNTCRKYPAQATLDKKYGHDYNNHRRAIKPPGVVQSRQPPPRISPLTSPASRPLITLASFGDHKSTRDNDGLSVYKNFWKKSEKLSASWKILNGGEVHFKTFLILFFWN